VVSFGCVKLPGGEAVFAETVTARWTHPGLGCLLPSIDLSLSRVHNRLLLAREGIPFVAGGWGVTVILYLLTPWPFSVIALLLTLFIMYFFRDPDRRGQAPEGAILSPADGKIIEVRTVQPHESPLEAHALKISIFMSVFDVHVNRIPVNGTVTEISYHPGRFFAANLDKASTDNESNRILIETPDGRKILVIQIAGLIARRIACWVEEADVVRAGQRFGLIRFGSRVEIFAPAPSRAEVMVGHRVRAGQTVLGYFA
jgi:phosphatidylserine decarboxylase